MQLRQHQSGSWEWEYMRFGIIGLMGLGILHLGISKQCSLVNWTCSFRLSQYRKALVKIRAARDLRYWVRVGISPLSIWGSTKCSAYNCKYSFGNQIRRQCWINSRQAPFWKYNSSLTINCPWAVWSKFWFICHSFLFWLGY